MVSGTTSCGPASVGNLGVDRRRVYGEVRPFRQQIADLAQEAFVLRRIDRLGLARLMPGIDHSLQPVALGEQRAILRREIREQLCQAGPKGGRVDSGPGHRLVFDEGTEGAVDGEAGTGDGVGS